MSQILVISPSGNFYGSEQVLFDYVQLTQLPVEIAVPSKSPFWGRLKGLHPSRMLVEFQSHKLFRFYGWVYWQLLKGKYREVYLNEAGHIKYISLLALLFKKKRFVVHVRMLEDTEPSRWKYAARDNITLISISRFLQDRLPLPSYQLYDGYHFSEPKVLIAKKNLDVLRVAVIGRITKTKGALPLLKLLKLIDQSKQSAHYTFCLYGEVADDMSGDELLEEIKKFSNVQFKGFENDKKALYDAVDVVLHLSVREALGRIFFEAIDYGKPFVGYQAAGIAEIGGLLNLSDLLADPQSQNPIEEIFQRLKSVRLDYQRYVSQNENAKAKASEIFNPNSYTREVDKFLS